MGFNKYSEFLYKKLLSDETRKKLEKIILIISITSFFVHLMIIFLVDFGFIALDEYSDLLTNPIRQFIRLFHLSLFMKCIC